MGSQGGEIYIREVHSLETVFQRTIRVFYGCIKGDNCLRKQLEISAHKSY